MSALVAPSDWSQLDPRARRALLARPGQERQLVLQTEVAAITAAVRERGDAALREYALRFDGVAPAQFAARPADFAAARAALSPVQEAALRRAINNVETFHRAQMPRALQVQVQPGVTCERIHRPIPAVGLYVPAGSAPLPSTVVMLGVPARLAGCPVKVLCTPPGRNGQAHPAVLRAAELCGIDTVLCVGGAHAIAALAYGTASVPKVDKIFGPGNAWVTAAKQLVAADPDGAASDMPAGPSEVLVLADASARADFVAADLLAQAEHDARAHALLVTTSARLAREVAALLPLQAARLARSEVLAASLAACRLIQVDDLDTALEVCNEYAPEHLILQVREPRSLLGRIANAGSVFLGEWSPEPMGDYCSGTNHVLPTYGHARAYAGLSVESFMKAITVQELSPAGLAELGPVAVCLAELEGLGGHAAAVQRRLDALAVPA